ncbi:MAG: enoyl-CoA hydratase/isomerase family protein [Myxococcales bacterium]|nr:enoyl-CoA hydratase/isomerase family protein [Myxococcales bacterium]
MQDHPYETLLVHAHGGVATITLNLPERKNPLGPAMVNELLWALDEAKQDPSVRVIVLTGAGSAFSAGGDLKQMSSGGSGPKLAHRGDYVDLLLRFTQLGKPTIARIPGHTYGGGLGLVASCDFAIAAESAKLGTPEIKRGLFPMMIMAVLARVMPRRELLSMMLLGESLSAAEAKRVGILSHVVPDEELDAKTTEISHKLAKQSPTALRMGLAAYHHQADRALTDALPYLRDQLFAILGTEDAREGLSAFLQKREPVWTGR